MLKNIVKLATCLVFLNFCINFVASQQDEINKFIQLLPENQKQAFFDNISRRIYEKLKADGITKKANKEMVDEELNAHNGFVDKILEEERQNLRKNNDNTLSGNKKEESSNRDDFNNEFVDLTLRTSDNAENKSDSSELPRHSVKKDSAIFQEVSDSEKNETSDKHEETTQNSLNYVNESSINDTNSSLEDVIKKGDVSETVSDDARTQNDAKSQEREESNTEVEPELEPKPQNDIVDKNITLSNTTSNHITKNANEESVNVDSENSTNNAMTGINEKHSQGYEDSQEGSTTENSTTLDGKDETLLQSSVNEKPIIKVIKKKPNKIIIKTRNTLTQKGSLVNNKTPIKLSILRNDDGTELDKDNHEAGDPNPDDTSERNDLKNHEESVNVITTTENNLSSLPTKEDTEESSQTRKFDPDESKTSTESVNLLLQTTTENDFSSLPSNEDSVNVEPSQTRLFNENEIKTSSESVTLPLQTTTKSDLSSLPSMEDSANLEASQTRRFDQDENKTYSVTVILPLQTTTENDISSQRIKEETVNVESSQTRRFDQDENKKSTEPITLLPLTTNDDVILTTIDAANNSDDSNAKESSVGNSESKNTDADDDATKSVLRSGNESNDKENVRPNELIKEDDVQPNGLVKEEGVRHYEVFEVDPNETPFIPAEAVEITKSGPINVRTNSDEQKASFHRDETRKYRFKKKNNNTNSTQNNKNLLLSIIPLLFPMKKFYEVYNFEDKDFHIFDERREHSKQLRNTDEIVDRQKNKNNPVNLQNKLKPNSPIRNVYNIESLLSLLNSKTKVEPKHLLRKNYRTPEIDMDYFFGRSGLNSIEEDIENTIVKTNLLKSNVTAIKTFTSKYSVLKSHNNYGGIQNQKENKYELTVFRDNSDGEENKIQIVNLTDLYQKSDHKKERVHTSEVEGFDLKDFEGLVNVIGDMIKMENNRLLEYDWLSSTVDIQSGLTRLSNLVVLSKSNAITKPDQKLLKYVVYIFETARTRYQEYKQHPSRRILGNNKEKELFNLIKKFRKFNLPSSRQQKLGQKIKKPLEVLERVWKLLHATGRTREESKVEKELADFEDFVTDLNEAVFDLHTALNQIAKTTKYQNQNWLRNLKELYIDPHKRRHKLQVLLHLVLARILRLIEESTRTGVEKDFLYYLARRQKEIEKTKQETVVLLKILDELKKV